MKLVTFRPAEGGEPRIGAVSGGDVRDLSAAGLPNSMLALIQAGPEALEAARAALARAPKTSLASVRILPPLPNPPALRDFFAFEEHAKAGAKRRNESIAPEWYEIPAYYKGNHRQVFGPDDEIPWPSYTRRLDFECEVACVVGLKGQDIPVSEAGRHIFGYMVFNDFSARDIQKKEMLLRMGPAKSKDFANAFGPWLVTADEVDPARDLQMTVRVNGEVWSSGHFKDQYWGFSTMLSHVSQAEAVYPGDLLGSGTFHKGCGLDLDRWIKPGDVVELDVPALGVLRNRVGAPKAQKELDYRKAVKA